MSSVLGRGTGTALVVALAFAVGAAAPATAADDDTVPIEAHAADGVVLRGHVYLPKGRSLTLPGGGGVLRFRT